MSIKKILLTTVALLFVAAVSFYLYFVNAYPKVDAAPDITIQSTPELVKRGEYIAHSVAVCMDCHSTRDWSKFSGPPIPGTLGKGGERFTKDLGFPGDFYAPNITPYKLKEWTDGEIYRAITSGVSKDGRPLFPVMPYHAYGKMAKEDIYAIIAYLRTLPEQQNDVPVSKADFPFNLIMRTMPMSPSHAKAIPDQSNPVAYGQYLFTTASCIDCHTPFEKGEYDMNLANAGGREFPMPGGVLRSPNITPHPSTGIGQWTEEQFVNRFRAYADSGYVAPTLGKDDFQTIMPWTMYGTMSEADLKAIYAYLKQLKPIEHNIERFTPLAAK